MNLVTYRILYEDWMELLLPGGIVLRVRGTLGALLDDGPDKVGMRIGTQFQTVAPENMRGKPKPVQRQFQKVPLMSVGVAESAYQTDKGVLLLKTHVNQVFRTDGFDQHGEPIFNVESTFEVQGLGKQQKVGA